MLGLEPSEENRKISHARHPHLPLLPYRLSDVVGDGTFDLAVAVMSFEHIVDLRAAFRSVERWLKPGGVFLLVCADDRYWRIPRFNYMMEEFSLPDGQTIVKLERPWGTVYDVVRSPDLLIRSAESSHFCCTE